MNKYILFCIIALHSFAYPPFLHAKSPARVSMSSHSLKQGEILLVNVETNGGVSGISGKMFSQPVYFYKNSSGNNYRALIGIDMETKPDRYTLTLFIRDKKGKETTTKQRIRVIPANFRIQELTLPSEKVTLDGQTLKKVEIEKEKLGKVWIRLTGEPLWDGDFLQPVAGNMSDNFGLRRVINGEKKSPHTGVDVDAPEGAPVLASNSGRIAFIDDQFFSGKSLVIDHGLGLFTMYFHLSDILVKEGAPVKKGDTIAKVGKTGRATGPHLHWGVRLNGARTNPASLIRLSSP